MNQTLLPAGRILCFLIILCSFFTFCLAVAERWSQVGKDAQNTKRTAFSTTSPKPWQLSIDEFEFISGGFDENHYFAVDGNSGNLYMTLQAADWKSSAVFQISLQDGSIRNSFHFNTTCNYQECPFALSYSKNNVITSNGDILSEFTSREDPGTGKGESHDGVTSFSFSQSGEGAMVWSYYFPASIKDQVMEPLAVTPDDVIIVAQFSAASRYSVAGINYLQKAIEPAWFLPLNNAAVTAPAVDDDGHVYVNYNNTKILRIDGKTGAVVSTTVALPDDISVLLGYDLKPAVGSKRVYTVARDPNPTNYRSFTAVAFSNDLAAGAEQKLLWKTPLYVPPPTTTFDYPYSCSSIIVAPSLDKEGSDNIYVVCSHPNATITMAYALDGATGEQLWFNQVSRVPASRLNCNSASISNGNKYLALHCIQMFEGNLQVVVLEAATGKVVNNLIREATISGFSFLDNDDHVYFAHQQYNGSKNSVHVDKVHMLEREPLPKIQISRKIPKQN